MAAPLEQSRRLFAIDWLRGIVMVLMALDHTRDYFGALANPQDPATASPALFATRWVTHVCAPTFVFLAGTSAWLYGSRGRSRGAVSRFLVTRGLWLVFLEVTVVTALWMGSLGLSIVFWQVIAAIGVAMVALSALVFLPRPALLCVGLLIAAGHNLLDPIAPEPGRVADLWRFVHEGAMQSFGLVTVGETQVLVIYPLLPWIGVMVLGYCFGPITRLDRPARRRTTMGIGAVLIASFVALRWVNGYGDPTPWSEQATPVRTLMSFLNAQKYPPSLAFTAMTLGPALVVLGLLDREPGRLGRALVVYGRVPLFYYLAHMGLIHLSSVVVHWLRVGEPVSMMRRQFWWLPGAGFESFPEGFTGLSLGWVYVAWLAVVVALYLPCVLYERVKRESSSPLFSYL